MLLEMKNKVRGLILSLSATGFVSYKRTRLQLFGKR